MHAEARARHIPRSGPCAVIAEDEDALRHDLETRLTVLWPALRIVAAVSTGTEALAMFDRHRPQLMFLDIQMPGLSGLDVARQVADRCHVVFITAFDIHAVAAFEHGAVDYILKPYDSRRLGLAVRRVQARLDSFPPSLTEVLEHVAAARQKPHLNWIKASTGADTALIMVRDVCYFRADTKYTTVVTADREFIIRRSIKELVNELDPATFWQIHRSTIVNIEAVASATRNMAGATLLNLKHRPERLEVSESHRSLFRHM